ncbi:hypothetical protein GYH30_018917, partial [Glycine max]
YTEHSSLLTKFHQNASSHLPESPNKIVTLFNSGLCTPSEQPLQDIVPNNLNILIGFPEEQQMHHPFINPNRLILTPGLTVQLSTPMQHYEGKTHITEPPIQQIGDPQKLHHSPQPGFGAVTQMVQE